MSKNLRFHVRLARETMLGILELQEIYKHEPAFNGIRITKGFVVSQAFLETKDNSKEDWKNIVYSKIDFENSDGGLDTTTNLYVQPIVLEGIEELKALFPEYLTVSYVTTSYVIRQVVKSAVLKRRETC